MPATYEPIATTTLGSAASSITFSSIPGTYTDLRLTLVATSVGTSDYNIQITFNSDTGTNYSKTSLQGNGTAASSSANTNVSYLYPMEGEGVTTTPSFYALDIFSYAGSTNKSCLIEQNIDLNGSGRVFRSVGLWRSTSAITTISLLLSGSNFATGTRATLYGILRA
jgi:archaellum component FlaF (FlaF/FlaG flagellin family)